MESVAGVRKPIKAGSSDVITVTKDLQSLGLETGDEVCFWLSKNTPENDRILRIVTLSESGEYDIMNGLWLKLQSKNEYDDPSKYLDEESIAVVDDLETIQHTIFEVLNKYLKERNTSGLFYYSDELRSFVRTSERVGKGSNDSTRTNRDKLRYELLVLEFILALLQRVHMNKSPLLETRSTIVSIEAALKTYSDLIDGDLDDDSLDSKLSVLNTEWDNRQKAIASMAGTFIVILDTIVEAGTRLAHPIRPVEISLENTYSASLLENLVLSEIEFNRQQSEGSTDYAFKILGPLDEDSARTLAEYLRMGVQLNFPNGPSNEMLSWCENQYQNFINTKTDDQEDDE